jgi:hypothetical protein
MSGQIDWFDLVLCMCLEYVQYIPRQTHPIASHPRGNVLPQTVGAAVGL